MDVFEDERGVIRDLLEEPCDAVTTILTRQGAVRGNHVHYRTRQINYLVYGIVLTAVPGGGAMPYVLKRCPGDGDVWVDEPGVPHAWKAVTNCRIVVMTQGPRSGQNYESDTVRLSEADRLL